MRLWPIGLVSLAGSSCALLYDFADGAGGQGQGGDGPTTTAASTTIDATGMVTSSDATNASATGGGGGGPLLTVDRCLLLGGPASDLPGEPALALSGDRIFYTGTYVDQPMYFGAGLPKVDASTGRGIALVALEATTLGQALVRGVGHTSVRRVFVDAAPSGVLFGGSFEGAADFGFDEAEMANANGLDGFLMKYDTTNDGTAPPIVWSSTRGTLLGGSGVQTVSAAFEAGTVAVAAGTVKSLGGPAACDPIADSQRLKGFVRTLAVPTVQCNATTPYAAEEIDHAIFDMVATESLADPQPYFVAEQIGDAASATHAGHGVVYRYGDGTTTLAFDGSLAVPGLGRIRLASAADGNAFLCASRHFCTGVGACAEPQNRIPETFVSGYITLGTYDQVLTTELGAGESWVECGAIVQQNGDVLVSGRFKGNVTFKTSSRTIEVASARGDVDAFIARYSPDGNHLSTMTFGGAGQQDINTLVRGASAKELLIAGSTEGNLIGPSCDGTFAGVTDVFLMRATLGDH